MVKWGITKDRYSLFIVHVLIPDLSQFKVDLLIEHNNKINKRITSKVSRKSFLNLK